MKKVLLIVIAFLLLGSSAFFIKAESASSKYYVSYDTVVSQDKPGVVYFYSKTCRYCVHMAPIIDELRQEYKYVYNFAKLDVDDRRNTEICNKNRVWTIPAVYLYNPKAKTLKPIPPYYFSKENLREILSKFATKV